MLNNKNFKKVLASILTLTLVFSVFTFSNFHKNFAYADTQSSIQANKAALEQKKAQLSAQLEQAKKNTSDAQALHKAYENQIGVVQEQIDATESEINDLNSQISDIQEDITTLNNKIQANKQSVKDSVATDYKTGGTSFVDVLLGNNDNLNDVLDKVSVLGFVVNNRNDAISEMNSNIQTMQTKSNELGSKQKELKSAENEKQGQYSELKKLSDESQIQVDKLQSQQASINNSIKEVDVDIAKADADMVEYMHKHQNQGGGSSGGSSGGGGNVNPPAPAPAPGGWMCPLPPGSYRISSPFGDTKGRSKPHEGVDLAAPCGTPIFAANNGIVIRAGWINGYGNAVLIEHGNGYTTLYAHMSSIGTSTGATVSAGQVIGAVGSTGQSTGNHLHFGLYKNFTGHFGYECASNPMVW